MVLADGGGVRFEAADYGVHEFELLQVGYLEDVLLDYLEECTDGVGELLGLLALGEVQLVNHLLVGAQHLHFHLRLHGFDEFFYLLYHW